MRKTNADLSKEVKRLENVIEKAGLNVKPTLVDTIKNKERQAVLEIEKILIGLEKETGRQLVVVNASGIPQPFGSERDAIPKAIHEAVARLQDGRKGLIATQSKITVVAKKEYGFSTAQDYADWLVDQVFDVWKS